MESLDCSSEGTNFFVLRKKGHGVKLSRGLKDGDMSPQGGEKKSKELSYMTLFGDSRSCSCGGKRDDET